MTPCNTLIIDGYDIYSHFRCFTAESGSKSLVQFPKSKNIHTNDWQELDGIEADLSNPLPETRTPSLELYAHDKTDTQTLAAWLARQTYHSFTLHPSLAGQMAYTLRLSALPTVTVTADRIARLTLQLVEDDPADWLQIPPHTQPDTIRTASQNPAYPYRKAYRQPDYAIDGIVLSDIGFNVLSGTDASLYKAGSVKEHLKTSLTPVPGTAYYDQAGDTRFKSRDITLKLVAHTPSLNMFSIITRQLYGILMQPQARHLHFGKLDRTIPTYYKSMSVSRLIIRESGETWCEFSVTLATLTDRPQPTHELPQGRAYSDGYSTAFS